MKKALSTVLIFLACAACSQSLDLRVLKSLNGVDKPLWDKSMQGVSHSVYAAMPLSVGAIWLDGHLRKDEVMKRNAYKSAVGIGFALTLSTGLKYAINRPRPFKTYPNDIIQRDRRVGPFSFPSGHTTSAFATATALSLSYKKWQVAVPAYLYAGLAGYSRMRLGVHYPSDVLGGMLIGIGSGFLVWKLDKAINQQ